MLPNACLKLWMPFQRLKKWKIRSRLKNPKGEITLSHVSFGYETNHPVLKDISLHVNPGEMLGIGGVLVPEKRRL